MNRWLLFACCVCTIELNAQNIVPTGAMDTESSWQVSADAVYSGLYGCASDPSLLVEGQGLRRYYTGLDPVLSPTVDGLDTHALYSPVVVPCKEGFRMIYCGYAYSGPNPGVRILGATSKDGIHWTKHPQPVLEGKANLAWSKDGVAEPALVKDGDFYWLFFTGLSAEERCIGVAKGPTSFGPWVIRPEPILKPTKGSFANRQVIGPFVILEAGRARMWLLGTQKNDEQIRIGYAESAWPPQP